MEIFPQVVIAGVSGLVGQSLLRHFLANAVSCATLTRRTAQPGSSEYFWDPYHFQFREDMRRLSGIRAAILLSGDNLMDGRWTAAKKLQIRESRVRTTQSMVQLLSRLEQRPEVLLCASAVGFYGDRGDEILTEDSAAGHGFLPDVCREWEAAADAAIGIGVRVVHLRFGVVLAREGGALAKMLPLFRLGLGGNLGRGQQWMSWIALPTLVIGKDVAIYDDNNSGRIYKIGYICGINLCGLVFFGLAFWRPKRAVPLTSANSGKSQ